MCLTRCHVSCMGTAEDCKLSLYCGTEPIVESSQNMQFACFDFNYFSLRGQMARAGLKPWNNKWWMVYAAFSA